MKFETLFEIGQIVLAIKDGAQLVKISSFHLGKDGVSAYVEPVTTERYASSFIVAETQMIALPVDEDGEFVPTQSMSDAYATFIGNSILDMIPVSQVQRLDNIREESRKKRLAAETIEQTTNSQPVN